MSDRKYLEWQDAYRAARVETDESQLLARVKDAETAIFRRLQAIAESTDHHEERLEMDNAISNLRTWQTTKLKFPESR